MPQLPGFKASVNITTTPSIAFSNEATTDAGDHKTYQITAATKIYWDLGQALTVQTSPDGLTWSTVTTGFLIIPVAGQIIFASALAGATPSVRVSGNYLPYSSLAGATTVEIQTTVDLLDVTSFASNGWKEQIASTVGASYKVSRWWIDNFFISALTANTRLVISAYSGANSHQRFDAFAYIKQSDIKIANKAAISEDLEFIVDGIVYSVLS